jgi:hypothetical protein
VGDSLGRSLASAITFSNISLPGGAHGGYDPIAEKLFNQLDVDAFLLECGSERAGTFEPLRFVPRTSKHFRWISSRSARSADLQAGWKAIC